MSTSSAYDLVRGGKLQLKNEKKHKKKSKKRKHEGSENDYKLDEDAERHGGWWTVADTVELCGTVAFEYLNMRYLRALDNGFFELGESHCSGDCPIAEEMFSVIKLPDGKYAFKSGYGKYISYDNKGVLTGKSDAVGHREQWTVVFEDKQTALLGTNDCFLSLNDTGDFGCHATKVSDSEIVKIRNSDDRKSLHDRHNMLLTAEDPALRKQLHIDSTSSVKKLEAHYVSQFQHWQDHKVRISEKSTSELKKAKTDGTIHTSLLDRRAKMKSDKFCK